MGGRGARWLLGGLAAGLGGLFLVAVLPAVLASTVLSGSCAGTPAAPPSAGGAWLATAYGPPWGGIQGGGITATGLNLTAGPPAYEIAVDPSEIPLRSYAHVQPNPFGTASAFYAGDTGGAIIGRHVDIYDWRGRAAQDAWGVRHVSVTPAATPGAANVLGQVQAPAMTAQASQSGCSVSPEGYVNPFANSTGLTRARIDMGVDYSGAGPIDALGAGTITYSRASGTGWGPFSCSGGHGGAIVYTLAGGADRGRSVYVAEGIVPSVGVGAEVAAGQPIGTFTGCTEIGWAQGDGGDGTEAAALGQECQTGDPGCHSTWCGNNMSELIVATGGPAGVPQPGGIWGSGC